MPEDKKIVEWLHKLGVTEYFQRFKFGGFVGKLCVLGGLAILGITAAIFKLHDEHLIFYCIMIVAGLAVFIAVLVSAFAFKHPDLAMLEGGEIIQREQMQLAAKGVSVLPALGGPVPEPPIRLLEEGETDAVQGEENE